MTTQLTLATVPVGADAHLSAPQVTSQSARRLIEMGFTEGAAIKVVRRAPGRGPLEVHVRGTRVTLRDDDAAMFPVTLMTRAKSPTAEHIRIAVVGNPNCGKTTLFNQITGLDARTGNYPGITVEHREAKLELGNASVTLVDLPGTYSLIPRAEDEALTVRAILGLLPDAHPDALMVVLDATALERNLYLLLQLLELDIPVLAVVTMLDVIEGDGKRFEQIEFAKRLGLVVERAEDVSGILESFVARLRDQTLPMGRAAFEGRQAASRGVGRDADSDSQPDGHAVDVTPTLRFRSSADEAAYLVEVADRGASALLVPDEIEAKKRFASRSSTGATAIALERTSERYALAEQLVQNIVVTPGLKKRVSKSEAFTTQLDALALHPRMGPLFLVLIFGILFQALFSWAGPIMDGVSGGVGAVGAFVAAVIPSSLPLLRSLWMDGLVAGVGNVLVFVPQIFILFFALGILEDTGYLARAAFLLDRLMARVGLHGRAFVPLLSGFACAVPAVMAARTIENEKDRLVTILVTPLVSCSARLPVYSLVIGTLFATSNKVFGVVHVGTILMFAMYALGLVAAIGMAAVFKRTLLRSPSPDLVMELPPYRAPHLASLLKHTLGRVKVFVTDAGTIILALTVVLWGLFNFPRDDAFETKAATTLAALEKQKSAIEKTSKTLRTASEQPGAAAAALASKIEENQAAVDAIAAKIVVEQAQVGSTRVENSFAGRLGKGIEPIVAPLGFDWKIGVGLVASFAAREVLVSSLGLVYGLGDGQDDSSVDLRKAIKGATYPTTGKKVYTPLVGLSLMVFFVLAMQCMSTLAAVRRETGGWKWPVFQFTYMTALAYLSSLAVFQVGRLLGLG